MGRLIWLGLCFLFYISCSASEVVDLKSLDLAYRNFAWINPRNRPLLISPYSAKEGINLGLNLDLFKYGYLDLSIETLTTQEQFRGAGVQYGWGINVFDWLKVGHYHFSAHVFEGQSPIDPYPYGDAVEVRVNLFRNTSPSQSIFGGH